MIPVIGERYKAIEGQKVFKVVSIGEDKSVRVEAEDGILAETMPYQRFVEYWESAPDEAVAP